MNDFQEQVKHLRTIWEVLFPDVPAPSPANWSMWLSRYDPPLIQMVFVRLQTRYHKAPWNFPTPLNLYKFASAMMRRQAEAQHTTPVLNTVETPREENLTHA